MSADAAQSAPELSPEQIRLLTEIGMMAAQQGLPAKAEAIFQALRILRPQQPGSYVGLAMVRMNSGLNDEAIRVLERDGLAACPDDPDIRVFLGLALRLAKRAAESERMLDGVLRSHPQERAAILARSLLAQH